MSYDAVVIGGGPAGLSAALILGRARKKVLLCEAGVPRNAAAGHVYGFVTRDGTPPAEMRRIAREQLGAYPSVEVRDERALSVSGERGLFEVTLASGGVQARRVVLCAGLVDELPESPGVRAIWGTAIFQCPYCHGWEVQDRAWGAVIASVEMLEFASFVRGWTKDVVAFTDGRFEVPGEARERLLAAGVRLEERRIRRLVHKAGPPGEAALSGIEVEGGDVVPRDVMFMRPAQRQTEMVAGMGLELDPMGFVKVDEMMRTSRAGVYAAGDLTTMFQGALLAAGAGARAAYALNHELTMDLVMSGKLG
ncbi:MAG: NAD(P)/FAD-dependent oxidoreductase [Polyangiaceae bacterium]